MDNILGVGIVEKKDFLCKLGFHKWRFFPQAWEFYKAFPESRHMVSKECRKCKIMFCTDNGGLSWNPRL